ncbi:MAG: response regulator [Chloroflexi bacterium]|nr:response regulator [Chloroflexota bacterium]MBI3763011.1 response regulator [Chloroflexota bacterium]
MAEKILIVDDDLDTLKLIGLMLQRQGYEIAAANNGTQGLAKAAAEKPNLILLDLMMPDMDGYEVTRRLRANPELAHIPIIMFTAKTLVDDKVQGFEAGVDDYLTKPTHPAELASRVKALLQRAAAARAATVATEHGRIVGFLGAKGGLGTTTIALNVAVAMALAGESVIAADLRPGQGTMGPLAGFTRASGMGTLLAKPVAELSPRMVEGQLVAHASGLRLLLCSSAAGEGALSSAVAQAEAIVKHLGTLSKITIIDLGAGLNDMAKRAAALCDQLIVAVEPLRVTLAMGRNLLAELEAVGIGQSRTEVVMMNRIPSSVQTSFLVAQEILSRQIGMLFTPAPDLAYQAAERAAPIILLQPDSLTADQTRKLAQSIAEKGRLSGGA